MNSVLQHLFLVPGVPEDILAVCSDDENEESLFYQLQTVFGHLMESQLQYYVPDKFWKCFRMDGQPVNVREQQDAFEFYTRLTEQIDDYLKSQRQESVFAQRFEGVYSIQRICQDCPHRYEREEPFFALNLTVTKCHDLQDSLDQFVKGELLEGDNAYYCEKCSVKRTALIRTCVKTLPPVLVIQLKRFGYDWEASRALKFDDYFKFPWVLDMSAYTAEGLAEQEEDPGGGSDSDQRATPSPDPKDSLLSQKVVNTQATCSPHTPGRKAGITSQHAPRIKINTRIRHKGAIYELVGVIVHSGQASAGHYYSYIKDRRGDPLTNPNKGQWFKFNDTSVEQVEMNDALLEQECFGGTYKAKVSYDSSNPLPEDRLRYWNGYMLVYDSMDDRLATPKTPKTPKVGVMSRSFRASTSSARKSLSLGSGSSERRARTSLCELSHLLQQGEKQGMFREQIPPRILSAITHENLTFLKNRDIFSHDYYYFVQQLCSANLFGLQENGQTSSNGALFVQAIYLGMNFLLNTYLRTKDKEESVINQWVHLLNTVVQQSREACSWAVNYMSIEDGGAHIQPLLLECSNKMIRGQFSNLLGSIFKAEYEHSQSVHSVQNIIKHLLSLLASDVPAAVKNSYQYFSLLYCYCQQGNAQCQQILNLGGFSSFLSFLLGATDLDKRRWSSLQAQDFGPLHCIISTLITVCDMVPHQNTDSAVEKKIDSETKKLMMPAEVAQALYGGEQARWLKEAVMAYKEIMSNIPQLTLALTAAATENSSFTSALLTAVMTEYAKPPSNVLKNLSQFILEILNVSDSLQPSRTTAVLEGFQTADGENIMGLLDMIGTNKDYDSRRAYQCIKLVVTLSARCPLARDHLTRTQARWQWAVEWLRGKMDDHSATLSTVTGMSNEDSNTKNFQRTTSAQLTLEEATALLSELESTEMEIECDPTELGDIKESVSEHDTSPSQDLDAIDP
ncbi:ubiquitin carboxyl-terminal hydrolase 24-like isoform X1 [Homarus americanus]|uniref:ubiquitin carboxyl-terminal hydrolase 24-like isoform X1 n=1 Tax=Homarus americanus TaxID=6706 RepID=UPI001C483AF6|nr:ubiquitin carboxyl-terminal hydrolase 24-like isoform X1 [Homarus americanus]